MKNNEVSQKQRQLSFSCGCSDNTMSVGMNSHIMHELFPLYPWVPHLHCVECGLEIRIEFSDSKQTSSLFVESRNESTP